jgi:hypothetical protein
MTSLSDPAGRVKCAAARNLERILQYRKVDQTMFSLFARTTLLGDPSGDYLSAKRKIELLENDQVPAGSFVSLTGEELNAYVRGELPNVAPEGIRDPRLELGNGRASGFAYVDFPKLHQAQGRAMNFLLAKLLAGERPVRVSVRIRSSAGTATVDLERVEISGLAVSGAALDFLIQNFLSAYYPEAQVGQPFELTHRIERLEVRSTAVRVIVGR